jgi:hypothetical protein
MQIEMPFYDTPEKALDACIQALGGSKKVGFLLFPEKSPESAATYLSNCVDANRNEKLSLSHTVMLFKLAKQAGIFAPFVWFASECGYEARPVTRAEEEERLTAVIEQSSAMLSQALATLERIKRTSNIKAV